MHTVWDRVNMKGGREKKKTHKKGTVSLKAMQGIRPVEGTEVPVGGLGWYQPAPPPLPSPEGLGTFPVGSGKSLHLCFRLVIAHSVSAFQMFTSGLHYQRGVGLPKIIYSGKITTPVREETSPETWGRFILTWRWFTFIN